MIVMISIPLIPTIAFFWERLGIEKDAAMSVLRGACLAGNRTSEIKGRGYIWLKDAVLAAKVGKDFIASC